MPYTLGHPVAILPLRKVSFFTVSGLFIGSLSPDFEYVIRLDVYGSLGHSLMGLFIFCVPLSLLVLTLYRRLWRPFLASLFPFLPQESVRYLCWRDIPSVFVGAVTHQVWDSFTHGGRFFTRNIDFLNINVFIWPNINAPIWNYLQHLSTVGSLILLGFFCN